MFVLVGVRLAIPAVITRLISIVTTSPVTPEAFKIVNILTLAVLGIYLVRAGTRHTGHHKHRTDAPGFPRPQESAG